MYPQRYFFHRDAFTPIFRVTRVDIPTEDQCPTSQRADQTSPGFLPPLASVYRGFVGQREVGSSPLAEEFPGGALGGYAADRGECSGTEEKGGG